MTERQTPDLTGGERILSPARAGRDGWRGLPISVVFHVALIVVVGWTAVAPLYPALDESAGIIVIDLAEAESPRPAPPNLPDPPANARDSNSDESTVAKAPEPPAETPAKAPEAPK